MSRVVYLGGGKYQWELSEEELQPPPPQPAFSLWAKRQVNCNSARNAKVLDLHLQGLTDGAIGHIMGITSRRVAQIRYETTRRLAMNLGRFATFTIS